MNSKSNSAGTKGAGAKSAGANSAGAQGAGAKPAGEKATKGAKGTQGSQGTNAKPLGAKAAKGAGTKAARIPKIPKALLIVKAIILGTTWLSPGGRKESFRKEKIWVFLMAVVGIAVGGSTLIGMLYLLYMRIFILGINLGSPQLVIFYGILLSWMLIFFFGIPIILSVLYYSEDTAILIPLPLKTRDIITAKAMVIYLYLLPIHLVVFLPAVVVFARALRFSTGILVSTLSATLFGPLIPMALGLLFVFLISRAVNVARYKTAFELLGMVAGLFAILALQAFLSRAMNGNVGKTFASLNELPDIYSQLSRLLPPINWFSETFTTTGSPMYLYSILSSLILILAALLPLHATYMGDFSRRSESPAKGLKRGGFRLVSALFQRVQREKAPPSGTLVTSKIPLPAKGLTASLILKEWKILVSNSTFIFEAVGEVLLVPILLVIFKFVSPGNVIGTLNLFISQSSVSGLLVFGVLALMMALNGVAATSVSREGKSFYLSLALPISGRTHIVSKWLFQLLLFYPAYIMDTVLIYLLFSLPVSALFYIVPGGFFLITLAFSINIYFDLRRPILNWTHPQQAMKQNMNVLAGSASNIVAFGLIGFIGYLLVKSGVPSFMAGLVLLFIALFAAVVIFRLVTNYAEKRYQFELEV